MTTDKLSFAFKEIIRYNANEARFHTKRLRKLNEWRHVSFHVESSYEIPSASEIAPFCKCSKKEDYDENLKQ